ncbi:hypothetical protein MJI12_26470, partial [Salmonella enterica subsp. enterica serovar Kentucky]|nr:hypothetical protein [Salmonella enterica subsp. enterica serovar Kentucky]
MTIPASNGVIRDSVTAASSREQTSDETVKGAPVDMRAELRAAKLLMVDRNFEGEFTRLLALALSIA